MGVVPGTAAVVAHGPFDPDPDFVAHRGDDVVWEDSAGVWSAHPPSTLLLTEPLLWAPHTDWRLGQHELSRADRAAFSNFECEAIVTLTSASYRRYQPDRDQPPSKNPTDG